MSKKIYEEYRISKRRTTHMKLSTISLPESETLSMISRYRFDDENTEQMISEAERYSEEFRIKQEQKEYEEMNYDAICRRLYELSMLELLKKLFRI